MIRALWTSASGMIAQQLSLDVTANNLANVNTTGFKKNRAEFEDLMYQNMKIAGSPNQELAFIRKSQKSRNFSIHSKNISYK